ncbi:CoA ester lyase [Geomicrobium sp. JCM 19037]|uniref:HpcH/HpaI aldolase/citrate lyase family protein n=2 Tax=unclassified Geomicrobium TaxID=2628951 RepID=UPI002101D4A4|nr:aldolase/citrate lyase family protein [Geomicrobium sp. JCM 19037]
MEIAKASSKVKQFAFGAEDYRLDLNIEKSANDEALLHARSQIVLASKVAGLAPPIDSVFVNLHDSEGFKSESVRHRQLGFQGKLLIHPKQIEDLQSIYAVTDKEYEQALTICKAFEDAQSQGIASISVNGQMVDYPVYKQRKQLVERYESNQ